MTEEEQDKTGLEEKEKMVHSEDKAEERDEQSLLFEKQCLVSEP